MKKFLAIFTGSAVAMEKSGWNTMDAAKRKNLEATGMKAWHEWMITHQTAIVAEGGPLGKTKRIGPQGISDIKNNMAGHLVVQAETHEAASRMFENHPHFSIFPGDSVEVMECLPIPQMPPTQP
jgi:hypothetical protein